MLVVSFKELKRRVKCDRRRGEARDRDRCIADQALLVAVRPKVMTLVVWRALLAQLWEGRMWNGLVLCLRSPRRWTRVRA